MSWEAILREHLAAWEGCELRAYQDQAGVWTIGYGHTGPEVGPGMTISQAEADRLLLEDMAHAVRAVDSSVRVPLNDKMRAALYSLTFNIGAGAWRSSTACKRLNAGDHAGAAEAITWWNKITDPATGAKVKSRGLVNRREAERALFMEGVAELVGREVAEAPLPPARPGRVTGGAHKPLAKSKTFDASLLGTLLSGASGIGTALGGVDWRVAIAFLVVGGGFAYLGFNRWLEWKKGEH